MPKGLFAAIGPVVFYGNGGVQPASDLVIEGDLHGLGLANSHQVVEYPVGGVFLDDAHVPVGKKIVLQGFQLDARAARHIRDDQDAVVGESGPRADRGEFVGVYLNLGLLVGVFILEGEQARRVDGLLALGG